MIMVNRVAGWILTIAVPVLLIIGSVRLAMTETFLRFEYTRPGFPEDIYGFSTDDRLEYGVYGIRYILNDADIAYLADRNLPADLCYPPQSRPCAMFNELELQHMQDVKQVAQAAFTAAIMLTLAAAGSAIWLWRTSGHDTTLGASLANGARLTLGAIAGIVISALIAWDFFFDTFHALFFEPGTWRFYYSDTLIRLYPEQFWFDASLLIGGLTIIGALLILTLGRQLISSTP